MPKPFLGSCYKGGTARPWFAPNLLFSSIILRFDHLYCDAHEQQTCLSFPTSSCLSNYFGIVTQRRSDSSKTFKVSFCQNRVFIT